MTGEHVPCDKCEELLHGYLDRTLSDEEVLAHCRTQIAGYKCPRSVEFRNTPLPLSGAGKVLKRDLREPYWQGFTKAVN